MHFLGHHTNLSRTVCEVSPQCELVSEDPDPSSARQSLSKVINKQLAQRFNFSGQSAQGFEFGKRSQHVFSPSSRQASLASPQRAFESSWPKLNSGASSDHGSQLSVGAKRKCTNEEDSQSKRALLNVVAAHTRTVSLGDFQKAVQLVNKGRKMKSTNGHGLPLRCTNGL